MTSVRLATEADIPALVALGMRFLSEPPYAAHLVADPRVLEGTVTTQVRAGQVFVGEANGVVAAMLALIVFQHPYSGEAVAQELAWYSLEPRLGLRLLSYAEVWAQERGCTVIQMIAPDARVGKVYEHRGYRPVETLWQRRIEG